MPFPLWHRRLHRPHPFLQLPPVKPHGCLAYGVAGAVGGHFVGQGHAKLGAVGGCIYGWHKKHVWKKQYTAWQAQQQTAKKTPQAITPK